LFYNLAMVALCLFGKVSPLLAAIVMPVSSVFFVALTAWRLRERNLGLTRTPTRIETDGGSVEREGRAVASETDATAMDQVLGTGGRGGEALWTS
jgi:hypothetical protein